LQKEPGETFAFELKRMRDSESEDETAEEGERRRDQAAGGEKQRQDEHDLTHAVWPMPFDSCRS
jgi:hypothetical protein